MKRRHPILTILLVLLCLAVLAFAVTGPEFEQMLAVTEECFFHSPVWKPVRNRLRREEHLEDAKFTGLA